MRFAAALAAILPFGAALAQQTFNVTVGYNNSLIFMPDSITGAQSGDTINFFFASKNHTVTQSSFATPCADFTPPGQAQLVDSGYQPVQNGSGFPMFPVTLGNLTGPLWFYCRQTNPKSHCQAGMVFAVNPTADKSFAAFQAAAMASTNTTSSAAPGASTTAAGGSSSSGAAALSSTGSNSPASATGGASGTGSGSGSGSPSVTDTTASPTKTANAALAPRAGTAGLLLGVVGLFAGIAL